MKLLIVEHEHKEAAYLSRGLEELGSMALNLLVLPALALRFGRFETELGERRFA